MIKFVSDMWQVRGFLCALRFPPPIKLTPTISLVESVLNTKPNSPYVSNRVHLHFCMVFVCSRDEESGGILIYPLSVRSSVRPSGYRYMVCPAISSYSFGATALIFSRMFIHIMEACMSTGFWWSGGGIICVLQTHFIFFFKSLLTKQLCP